MRARTALTTGLAAVALISAVAGSVVSAADPVIPWFQRPATVGTGFVLGNQDSGNAVVSASGRWVAFFSSSTSWDPAAPVAQERIYLRDRWTDTTTRIAAGADMPSRLTMSADGDLVAGLGQDGVADTNGYAWIYRHSTGRTVRITPSPGRPADPIIGINNDGHFITSEPAWYDGATTHRMRAARIQPDGEVTTPTVAARGELQYRAITPSLRHAVAVQWVQQPNGQFVFDPVRIDLVSGATVSFGESAVLGPETDPGRLVTSSFAISPDGRYVAMGWYGFGRVLRTWDTVTGAVTDLPVTNSYGVFDTEQRAVLDDGRVIFVGSNGDMVLTGVGGTEPTILSRTFTGEPFRMFTTFPEELTSQVATDISRVLVCTDAALSTFDTNNRGDCSLKPF